MTARQSMFMVIMAALALGWAGTAGATGAATAAQKCEAFKNTAAGAKALCRSLKHAKQALGKPHNFAKCETRFMRAFAKAEQQAGGACPTEGDAAAIEALVDACASDVAAALSGGSPPPPCAQFPATGQTRVHRPGDDGAIQAGATLSYTDTGNGTIFDNNTGLEWEKKSDDGGLPPLSWTGGSLSLVGSELCFSFRNSSVISSRGRSAAGVDCRTLRCTRRRPFWLRPEF